MTYKPETSPSTDRNLGKKMTECYVSRAYFLGSSWNEFNLTTHSWKPREITEM